MKKFVASFIAVFSWFMMGTSAFAMCIWFAPPGRIFEPADNIKTLIVEQGNDQRFVVQPQWAGDATDFALIMPFPVQPQINEAPEEIFEDLENLTNPFVDFGRDFFEEDITLSSGVASDGVNVVDQRDVGDYSTTTLSATNASDLLDWLNDNGYEVPDEKQSILDAYIEGPAAFFVALKVNLEAVNTDALGKVQGELKPLEFAFNHQDITLPLRLMSDGLQNISLTIYTLSDMQYYIPGSQIQFSRKVTAADIEAAPSLGEYNPQSYWLVRNQIDLDPSLVESDIVLPATGEDVIITDGQTIVLNPDKLMPETGLQQSDIGAIRYVEDYKETASSINNSSDTAENDSVVLVVLVVALGISNLVLINVVVRHGKKNQAATNKSNTNKTKPKAKKKTSK